MTWVVIPAAGAGKRMGGEIPKQYLPLAGKRVIDHTVSALLSHAKISGAVLVHSEEDPIVASIVTASSKPLLRCVGGAERVDSVRCGLKFLENKLGEDDWVLVHDAARPCLCVADLDLLFNELEYDPVGGLLATPVNDTMKRADSQLRVTETVDRANLWRAMTPQMFRFGSLLKALASASVNSVITDEASAMEAVGFKPKLVPGRADNIKITHPQDLQLAEFFLKAMVK